MQHADDVQYPVLHAVEENAVSTLVTSASAAFALYMTVFALLIAGVQGRTAQRACIKPSADLQCLASSGPLQSSLQGRHEPIHADRKQLQLRPCLALTSGEETG